MSEIVFDRVGALGLMTLNRPKALNALTHDMTVAVRAQLAEWAADEAIQAVAVEGAGEKAFCAGGDVVQVVKDFRDGRDGWWRFFADEYRMNHAIATFPKPYVSLIDGISMGGGFGLSVHGSHRVLTPKTVFAMPETGLGLIADVGSAWVLPRWPGRVGLYLALTGYRCDAADSLLVGYGTHCIASDGVAAVKQALADAQNVDAVLRAQAHDPGPAKLADGKDRIDRHFGSDTIDDIIGSLEQGDDWAVKTHAHLLRMSPTSLKVTTEQMRRGSSAEDLAGVLAMEYRIVRHMLQHGQDFFEGVRALLIDKDKSPTWQPAHLDEVSDAAVAAHFAPIGGDELQLTDTAC